MNLIARKCQQQQKPKEKVTQVKMKEMFMLQKKDGFSTGKSDSGKIFR